MYIKLPHPTSKHHGQPQVFLFVPHNKEMIILNTIEQLETVYGIDKVNASRMIDIYNNRIGTIMGVNKITDITYIGDETKLVELVCMECGKVKQSKLKNGKNKWSEMPHSCVCQKIKKRELRKQELEKISKNKKDLEYKKIISLVGTDYGDYLIEGADFKVDRKQYKLVCKVCGNVEYVSCRSIIDGAKRWEKCKKHYNPVKYDDSYIGRKNNFLKVIGITRLETNNHRAFLCECDCGNKKIIEPAFWGQGIVKSCGCKRLELLSEQSKEHGLSGTRLYNIWRGMNDRCFNKDNKNYHNYGGRGITICDSWLGIDGLFSFVEWEKENGYQDNLTIDRINVNGNYEPDNCRWATYKEQNNNKRPSSEWKKREGKFEYNGKLYQMQELCEMFNTSDPAIRYRMNNMDMTLKQALETPKTTQGRPRKVVVYAEIHE